MTAQQSCFLHGVFLGDDCPHCNKHERRGAAADRIARGCSDGNCRVRKTTGQHTNGGCKCDTRAIIAQLEAELAEARRELATSRNPLRPASPTEIEYALVRGRVEAEAAFPLPGANLGAHELYLDEKRAHARTQALLGRAVAALQEALGWLSYHDALPLRGRVEAILADASSAQALDAWRAQQEEREGDWWGVWCSRREEPGFWRKLTGRGEVLMTTKTEAQRTADALNAGAKERTDSPGWSYEARQFPIDARRAGGKDGAK